MIYYRRPQSDDPHACPHELVYDGMHGMRLCSNPPQWSAVNRAYADQ